MTKVRIDLMISENAAKRTESLIRVFIDESPENTLRNLENENYGGTPQIWFPGV